MYLDCSLGLGYLPLMWSLFTMMAFVASYTVAVAEGHVNPVLPSVSDTGTRIPEANVFSFLMNISIMLAIGNFFTRYFQCQHQARHCGENREKIFKYNYISLIVSLTGVFGALIVANVQSRKENYFLQIHDFGAVVFFTFTSLYFWLQTFISYKVALYGLYSQWLCHFRLFISSFMSISSCLYFVTSIICSDVYVPLRQNPNVDWSSKDAGYVLHIVSNTSEWLSILLIMVFSITYFDEFQQVMLIIDCQEKSPIYSYDGIGEYSVKMSSMDSLNENNNN